MSLPPEYLKEVVQALKTGQLVALPTETVYGLAGNALDVSVVRKIFEVKGRPLIDPLIVHLHDLAQVNRLATPPPLLEKLANAFWPGPLTVILPKKEIVPDLVTAGLPSVAIRMPRHPIFQAILKALDFPLAAPSANPFGYISPTEAQHVQRTLGDKIEYIVDGGLCAIGLESTILSITDPRNPTLLRPGPIPLQALEDVLKTSVAIHTQSEKNKPQAAPGLLHTHYSPNTPLHLFEKEPEHLQLQQKTAIVYSQRPKHTSNKQKNAETYWLSEAGDLQEVAHNLFKLLQYLDQHNFVQIHIQKAPNHGIGIAINNRLEHASQ